MGKRVVVCGTGTDVGKTHVSVALIRALRRRNHQVVGLKPVESGLSVAGATDSALLAQASTFHVKRSLYGFAKPISPHLAARAEGVSISIPDIIHWVDSHHAEWQIVETAGGMLSPLGPGISNFDLMIALKPDVCLIVAPNRLGVLHDVSAVLGILDIRAPSLERIVVLSDTEKQDESAISNAAEMNLLNIARSPVVFPRQSGTHERTARSADRVLSGLLR